jgi:hypothetical protein
MGQNEWMLQNCRLISLSKEQSLVGLLYHLNLIRDHQLAKRQNVSISNEYCHSDNILKRSFVKSHRIPMETLSKPSLSFCILLLITFISRQDRVEGFLLSRTTVQHCNIHHHPIIPSVRQFRSVHNPQLPPPPPPPLTPCQLVHKNRHRPARITLRSSSNNGIDTESNESNQNNDNTTTPARAATTTTTSATGDTNNGGSTDDRTSFDEAGRSLLDEQDMKRMDAMGDFDVNPNVRMHAHIALIIDL